MMLPIVVFLFVVGLVMAAYFGLVKLPGMMANRELESRLRDISLPVDDRPGEDSSVVRQEKAGPLPVINKVLDATPLGHGLKRLIERSGVDTTPSAMVVAGIVGLAGATAGSVRSMPRGPMSNIHAMRNVMGNPSTTSAITSVTVQPGRLRPGSMVDATSITTQPAIAYTTAMRMTRRRRNSARNPCGGGALPGSVMADLQDATAWSRWRPRRAIRTDKGGRCADRRRSLFKRSSGPGAAADV
jgi:hypothetical protein